MFEGLDFSGIGADQPARKSDRTARRKPDTGLPPNSVAFATQADRHQARRAKSLDHLLSLLPPRLVPGEVWHVLSSGDVDALSYLDYVVSWQPLDHLLISTWVMAEADVARLSDLHAAGLIGRLDCYVGEVFPTSRIAEWQGLSKLCPATGDRRPAGRIEKSREGDGRPARRQRLRARHRKQRQRQHQPPRRADHADRRPQPVRLLCRRLRRLPQQLAPGSSKLNSRVRLAVVTASAFSFPARMCGSTTE
mgnify:CR=1 FL=1